MEDRLHRLKIMLLSSMFLIFCSSRSQEKQYKNSVYVDIYGDYQERATVKIDDDVIYPSDSTKFFHSRID